MLYRAYKIFVFVHIFTLKILQYLNIFDIPTEFDYPLQTVHSDNTNSLGVYLSHYAIVI